MNKYFFSRMHAGVTSIEVVIGVSIAGLVLVFSTYSIMSFINAARGVGEKTEALYLAGEGLELMRFRRDNSWTHLAALPLNTAQYLEVGSLNVYPTTTPETIGIYTRSIRVQNVYRHATSDDIVASTTAGSVADTSAKYVTATVSWNGGSESVELTTILADIEP